MRNKLNSAFWIGVIILLIAVFYLMDIFGIDFRHFLVLSLGFLAMIYALKNKIQFLKYIAVFLITDGVLHILSLFSVFNTGNIYLYYLIGLILLFLGFYIISKKRTFIIITAALTFVVAVVHISNLSINTNIRYAYYLYSFTLLMVVYYILENKRAGYAPLGVSLAAYLFGTNNLLYGNNVIPGMGFKLINLVLLLICSLLFLFISKRKISREENESEQ